MQVSITTKNERGENISSHYVGVSRIARHFAAEDIILYFKSIGATGELFPYNDYRVEKISGSKTIKNATVDSVSDEED